MVARELIAGVRRLPPHAESHERQYELRFRVGGAASCSVERLGDLLEGALTPRDLQAVVDAADSAFAAGDSWTLFEWPSGRPLPAQAPPSSPGETLRHRGSWIESSHGYRVRSMGRFGLEYVDGSGRLQLGCEWMVTPTLVLYRDSIPPDRPEVLERVMRLWLWSGVDVDLSPP